MVAADHPVAGPVSVLCHSRPDGASRDRVSRFLAARGDLPTLAHDPAWMSIFADGLGHRPYYLEAQRDGETVGVLPLALVSSFLFGRFLVSLPYLNQGGPLAVDAETSQALVAEAVTLARRHDVKHLELRQLAETHSPDLNETKSNKVLMWLELPLSPEELWKKFKPEVRNQIRKGEKSQLVVGWGRLDLLDDFYDVFARNMRDLGTPVFGRKLFASILRELGDRAELCVVRLPDQTPIAASLLLHGRGFTEVPSASSLREHNKTCANMLMYHHLLLRAVERGQRVFDFGRSSPDSGTFKFKRQWGAAPVSSIWQYHLRKGSVGDVRPDNPKYQRKIETWKKLPLWLTRLIGPHIVRGIP